MTYLLTLLKMYLYCFTYFGLWTDSPMKYCYFITYYHLPIPGLVSIISKQKRRLTCRFWAAQTTPCIDLPCHASTCAHLGVQPPALMRIWPMTSPALRGLKEDAGDYLVDSRGPQNKPAQLLRVRLTSEELHVWLWRSWLAKQSPVVFRLSLAF